MRTAAEMLKGRQAPEIIDLCAGTGAVALGLHLDLQVDAALVVHEQHDGVQGLAAAAHHVALGLVGEKVHVPTHCGQDHARLVLLAQLLPF